MTTTALLLGETLSPFKRRVDHFSHALNSNLIGLHLCPGPMRFNLVKLICLARRGTGEIIMLPKRAVAGINHPKKHCGDRSHFGSPLSVGWMDGLLWHEVARRWQASPAHWIRPGVNNGGEIEPGTVQTERGVESSVSSSAVIYSVCGSSMRTQSVNPTISVYSSALFIFQLLIFVHKVSANGRICLSVNVKVDVLKKYVYQKMFVLGAAIQRI